MILLMMVGMMIGAMKMNNNNKIVIPWGVEEDGTMDEYDEYILSIMEEEDEQEEWE